ncbi:carbohydrate esterase family 4 protein [Hebeloma cylindrosporum]|uniref:chitin deacetylase n=1 Tax=Hebeloma cylindrosporum TaxID=76867 RepID=A0A0C2YEX7_HEBCY|nr:carbohydrate esterase family 4 protein [Hebeloma cylindrosporum h7]
MKFSSSSVVLAVVPVLVAAHVDHLNPRSHALGARQVASPSPLSLAVSGSSASVGTALTPLPSATTTLPSVSLLATNPTAVPLSAIVSNQVSSATQPLATTAVPGTTPSTIPNAPALPNAALLLPSNYPFLDVPPPIDSPEVQQWIQEVKDTGMEIPGFSPTNPGGCPNNTAAVADTSRCWWTCGGCTRSTDITECPTAMDWGLTYDDGPSFYTSNLLSYLDQQKLKSTFFVVGSRVISFPSILQTEYMAGHQISVHTWSHPPLTTLSNEEIIAELGWSKKVIKDVLGVTPNTMRPPFGDIDSSNLSCYGAYTIMWTRISPLATFDTGDFNIHGGLTTVQQVLQNWKDIIGNATTRNSGFIVLEHDLFEQTVEVATGYILPDALAHNPPFTIQPVISCLNLPMADAYIETNDNKTHPPALAAAVSASVVTITGAAATGTGSSATKSAGISVHMGSVVALLSTLTGLVVGCALSARF